MKRIFMSIEAAAIKLAASLKRFPESLALITGAVILLIIQNHTQNSANETLIVRNVLVLVMGFFLFLCLRVLCENLYLKRMTSKVIAWVCSAGWLFLYFYLLLPDLSPLYGIRFFAITFSIALVFLFIPYLKRSTGFEMYIIKLFTNFFTTYLYALVLFAGLSAIIFTIDQLLGADINSKIYFDIMLVVMGIFSPAYFLADVPLAGQEQDEASYSKIFKILFLYIVMPILSVYTLILYVYFAKVLITQQWPKGMVSNLVLWYSIITAALIFAVKPLKSLNMWAAKFSRVMPLAILPLLLMCFWAIGIRISSYGFTESRYYVVIAAMWVFGVMLYWCIAKVHRNAYLPVSLAIIAILTIAGPQSAFSVSFNSQAVRLQNILINNGMLKDNVLVSAPVGITEQDKQDIGSILGYINEFHGLKKVSFIPEGFTLQDCENTLGIEVKYRYADKGGTFYNFSVRNDSGVFVDIGSYNYFVPMSNVGWSRNKLTVKDLELDYNRDTNQLKIYRQGKVIYDKSINDLLAPVLSKHKDSSSLDAGEMTFVDIQGSIEVKYFFNSFSMQKDADGKVYMAGADFSIFIR